MTPVLEDETQFLAWGDGPAGPWVKLLLTSSDALEPFRGMTAAKKGMAGQRLACVLVEIGDQEQPVDPPKTEGPKGGDLAKLAGQMCGNPVFQAWVRGQCPAWGISDERLEDIDHYAGDEWEQGARPKTRAAATAHLVREVCGVESRAELDHNPAAAAIFHERVRKPFSEFVSGRKT